MGNNKDKYPSTAAVLRRQAEVQLGAKTAELYYSRTEAETLRLVHELEVHHIELEMQNAALSQSRDDVETALDRYTDLYDFSPIGYFTINSASEIRVVNLTGATILGTERSRLIGKRFSQYVAAVARPIFSEFLAKVFTVPGKETCELPLVSAGKEQFFVQIIADVAEIGQDCRIAVLDITRRKILEKFMLFLARSTSMSLDNPFFEILARHLAENLAMDFVCIDRLEKDGLSARTVAVWSDGHFGDNVTYTLKDTPGAAVVGKVICCFPENVCGLFPQDLLLRNLRAESYLGVTLWSHTGQPIGLISVIGRKPLKNPLPAEAMMKLAALRAAGELERLETEDLLTNKRLELEELNRSLEWRVAQAVDEARQKDRIMILQSRRAALGEMINNIAHQWRQPLNTLGLVIQQLPLFYDTAEFGKGFLEKKTAKAMALIQDMSRTIDGFSSFFRADKEKVIFNVNQVIERTVRLIEDSFRNQQIAIDFQKDGDPLVNGYPNEYSQVVMNILMNARDELVAQKVRDCRICIHSFAEGDTTVVTITDNAAGIAGEILDKLFDPYFTTKGPDSGTGIGLFMSKTIIEKNMGGRLTASSSQGGAMFRIEVNNGTN